LVTLVIVGFAGFTLWGNWPPPVPTVIMLGAAVVLFYVLLASERRKIRHVLRRRGNLWR
jgi:hypothetical protein